MPSFFCAHRAYLHKVGFFFFCTALYRFLCGIIKVRRKRQKVRFMEENLSKRRLRRLRKKTPFKKTLEELLSYEAPRDLLPDAVKELPLEKINFQEAILLAQIIKAMGGDTQSSVFLRDTSGNKLKDGERKEGVHKKFEDF